MFRCLKRGPGFYGYLWRLTGPIALQNLITFSLGLIDTLMVSWLGNTQMAAVTTANVPVFLLISIVFGVQSGLGILVSQYWGKKDMESISRAIGVAAMLGTGITLVLAVVLDEYGGMDGIITVRNLIEQLVGDLNDEAEIGQPSEIELISTDTWKIMGSASLDDVAEELKIKLPVDEYETFGGYIFGELGAVPDDGSQFELETDDLWIKVMRVKEHRVENTVVKKLPPKEKGEQEERKERE